MTTVAEWMARHWWTTARTSSILAMDARGRERRILRALEYLDRRSKRAGRN